MGPAVPAGRVGRTISDLHIRVPASMSDREPPLIVSASGVRGIVGRTLTPELAARYGAAYGSYLGRTRSDGGRVLVARDSRTSGPLLVDAAAAGLRAAGWSVGDLGLAPTPTALLAVQDDPEARGGLIVTASHNPVEWNGLKLASGDGTFLSVEAGRDVRRCFEVGPELRSWDELGDREGIGGAVEHHLERILALPLVDREAVARLGPTVAVDAVHGAAGPLLVRLLEALGCRTVGMGLEPDGRFPRPPEPLPEQLAGLGALVRREGAAIGLAVDPDGDRLALVDGTGRPVGEDWTLALAATYLLELRPGPVVTNLSSSRIIADAVERAGQELHLAPVGEANVAARMRECGAVVGGEGNGGVMLPDLHLTRDAPLAAALVLSLLARRGQTLEGILEGLPSYHIRKERRPVEGIRPETLYARLREAAASGAVEDRQDGLRLDWPEARRWLHVRPSGTEPVLRIIAEAPTAEEAGRLASWVRGEVEALAPGAS